MHYFTCSLRAPSPLTWHAWLLITISMCLANLVWAQPALPQPPSVAVVMALSGQARAIDAQGKERFLEKGAPLFAGDRVVTSEASLVQVRLNDGGYMSVRANTEMVIDRFVFDEKDPNKSSFLVSLLRGGFRSITGLIGRNNPAGYQIRAATATIGIRGTDHEPVLILDTPEGQAQGTPGLYDKVNDGETFIRNDGGMLALRRGDIGFAPLMADIPPQVLLKIPEFYRTEVRIDGRDARDGGDEKANGGKRGSGMLLRPSVAGRREALSGGTPTTGGQTGGAPPAPMTTNNTTTQTPTTSPPPPTGTGTTSGSGTTSGTSTPSGSGSGTTTAPTALTPEQKRAILQNMTSPTAPKPTTQR
ncbi:MAG: FecR domain-containing protein [Pseudomonadota bacterium]